MQIKIHMSFFEKIFNRKSERMEDEEKKYKKLDDLKERRENIKLWMESGNAVPQDRELLEKLDKEIEELESQLKSGAGEQE